MAASAEEFFFHGFELEPGNMNMDASFFFRIQQATQMVAWCGIDG
jgi:hypothetical protein